MRGCSGGCSAIWGFFFGFCLIGLGIAGLDTKMHTVSVGAIVVGAVCVVASIVIFIVGRRREKGVVD